MKDYFFYQPVSPFVINQRFGENKACVSLDGTNKVITCDGLNPPSGYKSVYGPKGHLGLDLKAIHGQEVYCAQAGIVTFIDTNPKSGLDVRVETVIKGRTFKHIYEHLQGHQVRVGDKVETGQIIGWADNTGYSSLDHLHFELQEEINNQFVSIDPLPLMAPIFAKDILWANSKLKWVQEQLAMLMDRWANKIRTN